MARKVFYSFHFKRDAWRAAQVRNSNMIADDDEYGVIDGVEWEKIERQGDDAIKRWINGQLKDTSVTAVLIGAETAERNWVEYEIRRSWERGNALVGVRVHGMKNRDQETDRPGPNPLDNIRLADGTPLSAIFPTYDWVANEGRQNISAWVEQAFQVRANYGGETALVEAEAVTSAIFAQPKSAPAVITNPSKPWAS